jgi:cell division protein FtsB
MLEDAVDKEIFQQLAFERQKSDGFEKDMRKLVAENRKLSSEVKKLQETNTLNAKVSDARRLTHSE